MIYFSLLQTIAAFIVKAAKIDANGDNKISGSEINVFLTGVVLPLVLQISMIKLQVAGFAEFVKDFNLDKLKTGLRDIIEQDLLPSEMAHAEEKIDVIALAVYDMIVSSQKALEAFKEVFGNKKIEISIIETPKVLSAKTVIRRAVRRSER